MLGLMDGPAEGQASTGALLERFVKGIIYPNPNAPSDEEYSWL